MRQLITILFFLIFAVCGNCQLKSNSVIPSPKNTLLYSGNILNSQNALLLDDEWLDTQDTNDLDNLESVSVLPEIYSDSQKFEVSRIAPYISELHSVFFNELFLDLPPPVISI